MRLISSKYKYSDKGFSIDYFSLRRFLILLIFGISLFATLWAYNIESFVYKNNDVYAISHKSKTQVALEKYIISSNNKLSATDAQEYASYVIKSAKDEHIDPFVLIGILKVESNFNRYAVSKSNAIGLAQVQPSWHMDKIRELKKRFGEFDIFKPAHNIALGAMVYSEYLGQLDSVQKALSRYNGHPEIEYSKMVLGERDKAKKYYN